MSNLSAFEYNGVTIQASGDRLNLNNLWEAAGKPKSRDPRRWLQTEAARSAIKSVCIRLNLPASSLIQAYRGKGGGTYSTSEIAELYKSYLSTQPNWRSACEKAIQVKLSRKYKNSKIEVITAVGKIDLLTKDEIIEIKEASAWKSAIGQVLVYSNYYPSHAKRIHLFGECSPIQMRLIEENAVKFGILVTWEKR